jgi:hypothetical protein
MVYPQGGRCVVVGRHFSRAISTFFGIFRSTARFQHLTQTRAPLVENTVGYNFAAKPALGKAFHIDTELRLMVAESPVVSTRFLQ